MILKDGTDYDPVDGDILQWQRAYPKIDVYEELAVMESWCDANPAKRKTKAGIKRFINAWLKRANVQGGSGLASKSASMKTREMTQLDDLTQNFTGDPEIRRFFIEKYGQSYEDGKRITELPEPEQMRIE